MNGRSRPVGADHHFDGLAAHLHGDSLGQLVQVEPVGDDGGEIQLAGVNQPHGPLVAMRRPRIPSTGRT